MSLVNASSHDAYFKLAGSGQTHLLINQRTEVELPELIPLTKYRIKKSDGKLIANLWTNSNGFIFRYTNYREHLYITVDEMTNGYRTELVGSPSATQSVYIYEKAVHHGHLLQ
jgi:hypothetical protein